jgi:5-hydroxyisourate hydrolase
MTRLTTHVLDVSSGAPAAGMRIELHAVSGPLSRALAAARTNADGRCPQPLLEGADFRAGRYSLVFHVAEYFRSCGVKLPDPPFLDRVVIEFGVADPVVHYHVPLLVTPWSYSTYRGS